VLAIAVKDSDYTAISVGVGEVVFGAVGVVGGVGAGVVLGAVGVVGGVGGVMWE
jgi:hypothetical protein